MNQLLRSLEALSYIERSASPHEGRSRIVRFTPRGQAAYAKIYDILMGIELEWEAELGSGDFKQFKKLLAQVWNSNLVHSPACKKHGE